MKKLSFLAAILIGCMMFYSCTDEDITNPTQPSENSSYSLEKSGNNDQYAELQNLLDNANSKLVSEGANYRVFKAEYITNGEDNKIGNTVYAKDVGNKQLGADFIPFDFNRTDWSGPVDGLEDNITYAVDQVDAVPLLGGLTAAQTTDAIDRAMTTWDDVNSTNLPINKNPDGGYDLGLFAYINGLGGSSNIVADIMHCGFTDIDFAGGVLGVTITWIWTSAGEPTDMDNNGKLDVAFREIYYDPSYTWRDDGINHFDVETIALHETGHGLSQGHFGKIFYTEANEKWHFAPLAVMNALYSGVQRDLKGTDIGGHSSIWADWPNN